MININLKMINFIKYSLECKKQNINLVKKNLSIQTFSNVSVRINKKFFTIKPSGVIPKNIKIKDCPIIRVSDGKKLRENTILLQILQLTKFYTKILNN